MQRALQQVVAGKELTVGTRDLVHSLGALNTVAHGRPDTPGRKQDGGPGDDKAQGYQKGLDELNQPASDRKK